MHFSKPSISARLLKEEAFSFVKESGVQVLVLSDLLPSYFQERRVAHMHFTARANDAYSFQLR